MWSVGVVVVVLAVTSQVADAYPSQVATKACVDMTPQGPGHNNSAPQSGKAPYAYSQDNKAIRSSESVDLSISRTDTGPTFAAFMVQARQGGSTKPVGSFQAKDGNSQAIKCTGDNDTGSHTNPIPKESVTLTWIPPTNFKGTVTFYCTVAETKLKFWVKQRCGTLQVK